MYTESEMEQLRRHLSQENEKTSVSEKQEKEKLSKYQKILDDLSSRYPHVKVLAEKYPRLNEIMMEDSFVREILLTSPGNEKLVAKIPDFLTSIVQDTLKRLADNENQLREPKGITIEEVYAGLYGVASRKKRTNSEYELMVACYESDELSSTMPNLFRGQQIQAVQMILGHIPCEPDNAQKYLEDSYSSYSELDVEMIQKTDRLLIAGQDQKLVDLAMDEESPEGIDYIVVTRSFQKYLKYLQAEQMKPQMYDDFRKRKTATDIRISLPEPVMNYIGDCFMELTLDKNGRSDGVPFVNEDDIKYFLQANFSAYGEPVPCRLISNTFTSKSHLSNYIGKVFEPLISEKKYLIRHQDVCNLLVNNFDGFQNQELDTIQKSLRRGSATPVFLLAAREKHYKHFTETYRKQLD